MSNPSFVLAGETFIYELNAGGSNRWWLNVSPGHGDNGEKLANEDIKDVISLIAATREMYAALQVCHEAMAYMSEYDIPTTLPDQVSDALKKARGEI